MHRSWCLAAIMHCWGKLGGRAVRWILRFILWAINIYQYVQRKANIQRQDNKLSVSFHSCQSRDVEIPGESDLVKLVKLVKMANWWKWSGQTSKTGQLVKVIWFKLVKLVNWWKLSGQTETMSSNQVQTWLSRRCWTAEQLVGQNVEARVIEGFLERLKCRKKWRKLKLLCQKWTRFWPQMNKEICLVSRISNGTW